MCLSVDWIYIIECYRYIDFSRDRSINTQVGPICTLSLPAAAEHPASPPVFGLRCGLSVLRILHRVISGESNRGITHVGIGQNLSPMGPQIEMYVSSIIIIIGVPKFDLYSCVSLYLWEFTQPPNQCNHQTCGLKGVQTWKWGFNEWKPASRPDVIPILLRSHSLLQKIPSWWVKSPCLLFNIHVVKSPCFMAKT